MARAKKLCPRCGAAKKVCSCGHTFVKRSEAKPPKAIWGRFPACPESLSPERHLVIRHDPMDDATTQRIKELTDQGLKAQEISRLIQTRIYYLRQTRQLELRESRPKEEYERAQRMWKEGATIQEIADAYGYSFKRMYGVIEYYRKTFQLFPRRQRRRT